MATSTVLAYVSGAALVVAVLSVIALHFGEQEMTPIRDAVSHYVHAPLGVFYYVQVVATGISALALLAALRAQGVVHARSGYIALGLYGAARVVIALFPADPKNTPLTERGRVHGFLAIITFAAVAAMTLILTPALASQAAWSGSAGVLWIASIVTTVSAVLTLPLGALFPPIFGLVERGIYLGAFVWLGTVVLGLIR